MAASATEHAAGILSDDDDDALFLVSLNESAGDDVARARARLLLAR